MEVLFASTRRKVLSLFFMHPDKQFYFREVLKLTGTKQGAVQRELKSLNKAGILELESRGNQTYYAVNKSHPIYPELRGIVLKTFGLADVLRDSFSPFRREIEVAFIYGSTASGEETGKSDIDLLVIGRISFERLSRVISKAERELGREINPTLYPSAEFRDKIKRKNHFLRSVLKSQMIFLVGDKNDLGRLAE